MRSAATDGARVLLGTNLENACQYHFGLGLVFPYTGSGMNLDFLAASPAVLGELCTFSLIPQGSRGPGHWAFLLRSSASLPLPVDLGTAFGMPPAGTSELLVGSGVIANIVGPPHSGGGFTASFLVQVPVNCNLVGLPWFAQAVVFGDLPSSPGSLDPHFSTAVGGIIGSH